jgi:hypothetical protein
MSRYLLRSLPTPMLASTTTRRRVATRTCVLAGGLLAAVLMGPAAPAAARQVDPPPAADTGYSKCAVDVPSVSEMAPASPPMAGPLPPIVVCTLEVAVPTPVVVADRATEMLHLGVAAVLGATLAAAATATRRRRRPPSPAGQAGGLRDDAHRLIDITDMVLSGPHGTADSKIATKAI